MKQRKDGSPCGPYPNVARNHRVAQMYEDGHSMREVGDCFGISFERVRQILRKYYPHLIRPRGYGMGDVPAVRRKIARGA